MNIFGLRDKALSFSICLIAVVVGCRDGRERSDIKSNVAMPHHEQVTSQKEENDDSRNAIEKFKTRVQQLAGMLDARGCKERKRNITDLRFVCVTNGISANGLRSPYSSVIQKK